MTYYIKRKRDGRDYGEYLEEGLKMVHYLEERFNAKPNKPFRGNVDAYYVEYGSGHTPIIYGTNHLEIFRGSDYVTEIPLNEVLLNINISNYYKK